MVREEWLKDGDTVITERQLDYYLAYIGYIETNYPDAHTECHAYLKDKIFKKDKSKTKGEK